MKAPAQSVLFILSNNVFQRAHTKYTKSIHVSSPFCSRPAFTDTFSRENTQCPLLDSIISPFTNDEGQTSKKRRCDAINKQWMCLKKAVYEFTAKKTKCVGVKQLPDTINKESSTFLCCLSSFYNNDEPYFHGVNTPVKEHRHDHTIFSASLARCCQQAEFTQSESLLLLQALTEGSPRTPDKHNRNSPPGSNAIRAN